MDTHRTGIGRRRPDWWGCRLQQDPHGMSKIGRCRNDTSLRVLDPIYEFWCPCNCSVLSVLGIRIMLEFDTIILFLVVLFILCFRNIFFSLDISVSQITSLQNSSSLRTYSWGRCDAIRDTRNNTCKGATHVVPSYYLIPQGSVQ